ncbi:DUF2744 domain-containing protein [Mycobacterium avium]|uniref:phage gene 29 protein family protein n=1 Tax=Mycobacterium avium TaxID=1764 RepID=UPI001CDA8491|nr:DUF2744 domain-containing protein [Mycobacterium avium]MCA2331643.1 DUF2744 domain-containing protein [Mycobacterium avium]
MRTKPIPSQAECDPESPEEHFLWALRNMPSFAGSGVITHSGFLRTWSKHLWECGFAHRDYLEGLADENGNIHVSRLPKQQIKFQEAFRGPQHTFNNAARWVRADSPEPEVMSIPDPAQFTQQEQYALAYRLYQNGIRIPEEAKPTVAEEFND